MSTAPGLDARTEERPSASGSSRPGSSGSRPLTRMGALLPGLGAAAAVAAVATALGGLAPVVGAPVIAVVTGMAVSVARPPGERMEPGLAFVGKKVLQGSVVVLGLGLSLGQVLSIGEQSLPVLLGTLVVALLVALGAGRALRLRADATVLIGVGTAVCGASAIAAADAVIDAEESVVSYAIATIFTFNVIAVLAYPALGHLLGLSERSFGLWAGTAVNDVSSVVAASTVYGPAAASYAVVVKLTRTLAIVPICVGLAAWSRRRSLVPSAPRGCPGPALGAAAPGCPGAAARGVSSGTASWRRVLPLFLLAFLAAVALNTVGAVPAGWHGGLSDLATWMITAALAGIGLSTRLDRIRRAGPRPLLLGALCWVTVAVVSLALQAATGTI